MKNKLIFALSLIGILAGTSTAYFFSLQKAPLPPVFDPASNPYGSGIYAEGIVESVQASGENINVYPEVAGTVRADSGHRRTGSNQRYAIAAD